MEKIHENWDKVVDWTDGVNRRSLYQDFVNPVLSQITEELKSR